MVCVNDTEVPSLYLVRRECVKQCATVSVNQGNTGIQACSNLLAICNDKGALCHCSIGC